MNLLEISIENLKKVILSHKEELSTRKGSTEMLQLAKSISKHIEPNNDIENHYHKLLRKLSSSLNEFSISDYSSLDSFIEHSGLNNKETCWEYLAKARDESDVTKKLLLLKIANRMDDGFIPEPMILNNEEIKSKFPLFWLDILFKSNKKTAIFYLPEIISENGFTFSETFPILDRWLQKLPRKDDIYSNYRDSILKLEKYFSEKDLILFRKWLKKRELKPDVVEGVENFKKKLILVHKIK